MIPYGMFAISVVSVVFSVLMLNQTTIPEVSFIWYASIVLWGLNCVLWGFETFFGDRR